jgi:hypothetical protein
MIKETTSQDSLRDIGPSANPAGEINTAEDGKQLPHGFYTSEVRTERRERDDDRSTGKTICIAIVDLSKSSILSRYHFR